MTFPRDPDRMREREAAHSLIDDDRAWGPIFAVVIISALALAALFFFMNRSDPPTRQTAVHEPVPAAPAAPPQN
jgi:hypothetical protein